MKPIPLLLLLLVLPMGCQGELPSLTRVACAAAAAAAAALCNEVDDIGADGRGISITDTRRQGGGGRWTVKNGGV